MQGLRLPPALRDRLRCPVCGAGLNEVDAVLRCTGETCGAPFPVVDGIPILINDKASVFTIADIVAHRRTSLATSRPGIVHLVRRWLPKLASHRGLKRLVRQLTPTISLNIASRRNYERLTRMLVDFSPNPRVLVLGGGILGQGMETMMEIPSMDIVESDVSFGPRTMVICDAHDIPFEGETFDGVIVQAVLEHVVDPQRCVEEIHRVLKHRGFVYCEAPFIQQVHLGPYDFTRFTHLGLRRLFRKFDEIDSGAVCGPGMALAWSYKYFLWSFATSHAVRSFLSTFATVTSFFLKYFDEYLIDKPGTFDAASGYYFLGRRGDRILPDRELLKHYRGRVD